ncbi:hypothetical protein [Bacillus sp. FJAT-47783]|uniref:hypothetical protein n=1 Tax=Bacillus sp. FJAT-47783 TaxID=2922712 RepID=UPI001FAE73CD|nr:hypothetical protein [Bacillus sp. FJAT-47783]
MTKNFRWNDDNVKQLLNELPKIEDTRGKKEIWVQIQHRKRKKQLYWLFPTFSFAALLLFVYISFPSLFYNEEQATEMSGASLAEESRAHKYSKEMAPLSSAKDTLGPQQTYVVHENTSQIVTVGFLDETNEIVIPVSFIGNGKEPPANQVQHLIQQFNDEEYGLETNELENTEMFDVDSIVQMNVPPENIKNMTYDRQTFKNILRETFRWQHYDKVKLFTNHQPGIQLPIGDKVTEVNIEQLLKKGYFLFQPEDVNRSFLVPSSQSYETIGEAFQAMKRGDRQINSALSPTILPDIVIEKVEADQQLLKVTFEEVTDFLNEDAAIIMIEAMLMTAKEFGFNYVKFEGLNRAYIGEMDVTGPIKVPYSPNPVSIHDFS